MDFLMMYWRNLYSSSYCSHERKQSPHEWKSPYLVGQWNPLDARLVPEIVTVRCESECRADSCVGGWRTVLYHRHPPRHSACHPFRSLVPLIPVLRSSHTLFLVCHLPGKWMTGSTKLQAMFRERELVKTKHISFFSFVMIVSYFLFLW